MIQLMWQSGELGSETGRTLQNTLFFYLTIGFGLRGCHESRQLQWGDVTLQRDSDGKEFLQFRERLTKTRKGDSDSGSRPFAPKIFAMEGDRCAIFFYKLLRSHRPESMCHEDSPFYLTPKGDDFCRRNKGAWYANMAMGKNTISKIVPSMAQRSGITAKITNHSLRRTLCQVLHSSGRVDATVICQLTGHKNVNSVLNYTTADLDQQRDMSNILTHSTALKKMPAKVPQPPFMMT